MSERITDRLRPAPVLGAVVLLIMAILPFYAGAFWMQTGLFVMAAAIGAIGLNILTGSAGQLSMAHAFFLAVGAYGYAFFAGTSSTGGTIEVIGLGLPTLLAMLLAVALAGALGLVFSPIASRLQGIYLGLASIALVFIGHHLLLNITPVTGGFNGRAVPPFEVFGFSFTNQDPLSVMNVPFGQLEKLWFLSLVLLVLAYFVARNILASRPGRALVMIRDSEVAAGVFGVDVRRYKGAAFVISSMYGGLAGVLLGLAFQRAIPDYFGLELSIVYLAMIVIGGLGSVRGAIAGAVLVAALPLFLTQYGGALPLIATPGESGIGPTEFAKYVYGALIVLVIMASPRGLAGLASSAGARLRRTTPTSSTSA